MIFFLIFYVTIVILTLQVWKNFGLFLFRLKLDLHSFFSFLSSSGSKREEKGAEIAATHITHEDDDDDVKLRAENNKKSRSVLRGAKKSAQRRPIF